MMQTRRADAGFLLSVLEEPSVETLHARARDLLMAPATFDAAMTSDHGPRRIVSAIGDPDRIFRAAMRSDDVECLAELAFFVVENMGTHASAEAVWIRHLERVGAVGAIVELLMRLRDKGREDAFRLAHAALVRACEKNPRVAFAKSVLRLLGEDARPILLAHAGPAVQFNPSLILVNDSESQNRNVIKHAIGEPAFRNLLVASRHAIAFSRELAEQAIRDPVDVGGTMRRFPELFPFYRLPDASGAEFYEALFERISHCRYFSEFEKSLRLLASQSLGNDTGGTFHPYFIPDSLWDEALSVVVLEDSLSAALCENEIRALPSAARSAVLGALVTLVRHGHADEEFDLETEAGRAEAISAARGVQSDVYGLELPKGIERLPSETIQAQLTYFRRTIVKIPRMEPSFRDYVAHVATDGFERWRNWGDDAVTPDEEPAALARMKAEGLVPTEMSLGQYRDWIRPETLDVQEELSFSAGDVASGIRDILSQAIADGHLSAETAAIGQEQVEMELEQIARPLFQWMAQIQLIDAKFARTRIERKAGGPLTMEPTEGDKEEYAELKARVRSYRSEHDRRIRLLTGLQTINRMRHLTAEEIQGQVIEIEKKRIPWARAFKEIFEGVVAVEPEFRADAERLRSLLEDAHAELFGGGRISRHELRLDDAIDPVALFHIGEKPVRSCQSWSGSGSLNVGLLSYQIDPNVRMILMRDENAALVARAALRLLQREDGKPALLIERVYSANVHPKIKEMVVRLARKKAAAMGVPLYTSRGEQVVDEVSGVGDSTRLESRGSRSAFVYTDAGGGKARNGVYSVEDAVELYKP